MKKLIMVLTVAAALTLVVGFSQTSAVGNEITPFAAVDPGNPGGG